MRKPETIIMTKGGSLTEDDFVGEFAPGDSEKSYSKNDLSEWAKMLEELKRQYKGKRK